MQRGSPQQMHGFAGFAQQARCVAEPGPAGGGGLIQLLQAGAVAGAACQQADEAVDAAVGLLGLQLQPAARQHLHINALARLNAQMGQ